MSFPEILEELYRTYYGAEANPSSTVTSSHWKDHHAGIVVRAGTNGRYEIQGNGAGFGNFIPRNFQRRLRHLPETFLSRDLAAKASLPRKLEEVGEQLCRQTGRVFEFDCAKQLLSYAAIVRGLGGKDPAKKGALTDLGIRTACVIGDGYGFTSSLLKFTNPQIRMVNINLGKVLFFDGLFIQKSFPHLKADLLNAKRMARFGQSDFHFLKAEDYGLIDGLPIDLFINIASMQEMDMEVIQNYFAHMRGSSSREKYFYSCNRVSKTLPDGAVINHRDYPWKNSRTVFSEMCPWYYRYPTSTPPFWKDFIGPLEHKLVQL